MVTPRMFNKGRFYFHCSAGFSSEKWMALPPSIRWNILCWALSEFDSDQDFQCLAFVMMNTHLHILFSTSLPQEHILMELFHQKLLSHPSILNSNIGSVFEEPLYCEAVISMSQYKNTYKYIYRNPVEAHLVGRCEHYKFSSLNRILFHQNGISEAQICVDQMGLIQNPFGVLHWLNSPPSIEHSPKIFPSPLYETPVSSFLESMAKA